MARGRTGGGHPLDPRRCVGERPGRRAGEVLALSRRTRLVLRVPADRTEATTQLCDRRLDIDGCEVVTGTRQPRPLRPSGTVFARYVVDDDDGDEERFVERVASTLEALSVSARKLLCGRSHRIVSAERVLTARSLMVAELGAEESLAIQSRGIGPERLLGCGLFVPHKDIGPVRRAAGDG